MESLCTVQNTDNTDPKIQQILEREKAALLTAGLKSIIFVYFISAGCKRK